MGLDKEHIMSDNYNQWLIESYKEQGETSRHDDIILHRMTVVILPVSITALIVSYVHTDVSKLVAIVGGVMLMLFWFILCQILHIRATIRFMMMNKIEEHWKIPGHRHFTDVRTEMFGNKLFKGIWLYRWAFFIYLFGAGAIGVYEWCKRCGCLSCYFILGASGIIVYIVIVGSLWWFVTRRVDRPIEKGDSRTLESIAALLKENMGKDVR